LKNQPRQDAATRDEQKQARHNKAPARGTKSLRQDALSESTPLSDQHLLSRIKASNSSLGLIRESDLRPR
jgi:hypothetical protein